MKFSLGFILTGLAFLLLTWAAAAIAVDSTFKTSIILMVAFYAIYTIAEMMLFPVFWSAVSRIASPRYLSLLMAVALSAIGIGGKLAGTVGSYVDEFGPEQIFSGIMITMFVLGGVCMLLNKKLIKMTEEDAPVMQHPTDSVPAKI